MNFITTSMLRRAFSTIREITRYEIITSNSSQELAIKVQNSIRQGYQPFGSMQVSDNKVLGFSKFFFQPVVMERKESHERPNI